MRSNQMSATPIRVAGSYLGAWVAIVCFVVLLSFAFTFLGTLTCAVLTGLMMGAFKGARWFSVSISLVFPGVILGMFRSARVELTQQQIILLAVVCFGVFWVTYLVSAVVLFCEQRDRKSSKPPAPAPQQEALALGGQVAVTGCAPAAETPGAAVLVKESYLEELQGNWVCEASSASQPLYKKMIQIEETKLELRAIDASGRMTLLARGDVTLQSLRPS
jgi:hypothetical protein